MHREQNLRRAFHRRVKNIYMYMHFCIDACVVQHDHEQKGGETHTKCKGNGFFIKMLEDVGMQVPKCRNKLQ